MAFDFPSSPSAGTQYVAPTGIMYLYDGSAWTSSGSAVSPNPFYNSFKYRTIYTRGYASCGYKNSSPWRNCNRTIHATDTTTNLGDLFDYAASYINGGWSDYNHYVYGNGSGAVGGSSTYTSSMSMVTETNRSHSSSWDTTSSRGDTAVFINPTNTIGYITAGGSQNTDKHNYVTDTMYSSGVAAALANPNVAGAATGMFGEFKGWATNGSVCNLTFSTETWASGGMSVGANDGHSKCLSSKHGFGYIKVGSYASTSQMYKNNDVTGSNLTTSVYSPDVSGEENYQVGQNWGYCVGNYNGNQNNNTYKVNYLTDAVTALGSAAQPKGHDGMSSGCCGSASAFLIGGPQ